ncbi:MAG: hypothetical protein KGN01_00370 [Patescibacteria group bacterium]|nr:hypothetical protein [Patescibacteria group bacterium]
MLSMTGCAGASRGVSSWWAETAGSDWIIVQYDYQMQPKCAWKLNGVSVTNETHSDGIYWKDSVTGHLIHISGWYNRVQVANGRFDEAAKLLGVDINSIQNGKYVVPTASHK